MKHPNAHAVHFALLLELKISLNSVIIMIFCAKILYIRCSLVSSIPAVCPQTFQDVPSSWITPFLVNGLNFIHQTSVSFAKYIYT